MTNFKGSLLLALLMLFTLRVMAQENAFKEEQLNNTAFDNRYASYNHVGETIIFESNRNVIGRSIACISMVTTKQEFSTVTLTTAGFPDIATKIGFCLNLTVMG